MATSTAARTVSIIYEDQFFAVTAIDGENVAKAIKYLSGWASGSDRYAVAKLIGDNRGNVSALYFDLAGNFTYELFGLRGNDGTYSFHS